MKEDSIVPDKMRSVIDYRIVLLIVGIVIAFHYVSDFTMNDDQKNITFSIAPIISTLAVVVVSFIVAKRYQDDWRIFFKSYIFLGVAFGFLAIGEIVYGVYDLVFDIDPYPSIADVFYGLFHIFTLLHLIVNTKHFAHKTNILKTIVCGVIISSIIIGYVFLTFSITDEIGFDFQYGLIFVSFNAVVIGIAVFGVLIFQSSVLGKIWRVLIIGITALTIGDIWYYYLELIGGFDLVHPVNFLWFAGYWIMVYALKSHKKDI